MNRWFAALLLAAASSPILALNAAEGPVLTPFSAAVPGAPLPAPWKLTTLPGIDRHTRYALVRDGNAVVLRADAEASMAGVAHPLKLDAIAHPVIEWRWKVLNLLTKSDIAKKQGDDFPARVYVLFDYDIRKLSFSVRARIRLARLYGADIPLAALCYVWDGKTPTGTSVWSAYTDRVRMIVAESGSANLGKWVTTRHNLAADFRAAFGEEPPPISGVVLATDTDNTGESATAFYGDIRFLKSTASVN
ncbi:MAG TPA: DUF3047 domain-containing protein [Burkholderiales bacterium]|nr:DUF3047 domain-containing protein [Burkholderiales bacterium]